VQETDYTYIYIQKIMKHIFESKRCPTSNFFSSHHQTPTPVQVAQKRIEEKKSSRTMVKKAINILKNEQENNEHHSAEIAEYKK
jgi:hypothetical protein